MPDINSLLLAEEASREDHIYLVMFEVLCQVEGLTESGWVSDELTVSCGEDGELAIAKVRAHVNDREAYPMETTGFRLKGLKLLAVADL